MQDKAYTSTSVYKNGSSIQDTRARKIKMELVVKKGTNLGYVSNLLEGEVILGRNQKTKLLGATVNKDGQYTLKYETI